MEEKKYCKNCKKEIKIENYQCYAVYKRIKYIYVLISNFIWARIYKEFLSKESIDEDKKQGFFNRC